MSRSSSSQGSLVPHARTTLIGAAGGALAFLLTYALTYAVAGQQLSNSLASRVLELATGDPGTWKLVGWVFFNAHYVTTEVPGLFGSTAVNLVGRGDTFPGGLFLLPLRERCGCDNNRPLPAARARRRVPVLHSGRRCVSRADARHRDPPGRPRLPVGLRSGRRRPGIVRRRGVTHSSRATISPQCSKPYRS